MKSALTKLLTSICVLTSVLMWAQDEEANDNRKSNGHLGMPISIPLNPMGQFAKAGVGVTYGAGYNFTRRHAVIGEFMWDWLHPSVNGLTGFSNLNGHSNLFVLSGNYRFELRGNTLGTYFIAGGGWYLRQSSITKTVVTGNEITCTPAWLWWGATCSSGVVTANQTLRSSSSSAFGANGGIGFTVRVGDAPYRMYVESRYHYAPTKFVNTQLIITTVGIRY
jgi:Outer membrane protein beta-barrel domain